ncbi:unnamed protein product [Parnassius apollo]|uniref:(apollo) hypothetical protein n=1 Tax=Parnassius apollo TaxID=110799 RepID=A0A8S3WUA6_PARAO|nr:unnamed protein product [Parnassius apollo]
MPVDLARSTSDTYSAGRCGLRCGQGGGSSTFTRAPEMRAHVAAMTMQAPGPVSSAFVAVFTIAVRFSIVQSFGGQHIQAMYL